MKHSFYWKVTIGDKFFFVVEDKNIKWHKILNKALKNLPFKEIDNISKLKNSNFHKFVLEMYSDGGTIMTPDGIMHKSPKDNSVAESIFNGKLEFPIKKWRSEFTSNIDQRNKDYRPPKIKISKKANKHLNKCLTYFGACDTYRQWVLEESRFFSLGLILDSLTELEASLLLSSNFYYKQATHSLRNFLELIVAQFYFSSETSIYDDWRLKPKYKMPYFRGKKGMVKLLKKKGKITKTEADSLEKLFGDLSSYTHSKYEKLLHFDPRTKKIVPFDYNERYLLEWINLAIKCMKIGLIIFFKHTKDWEKQLENNPEFICPGCHNNKFTIKIENYGNKKLYLHSCKKCGNQLRIDKIL